MMRLAARDLTCLRGGYEVFRGLSFEVRAGEALMVTGPNGAGKTSLLRVLAGLLHAAQGEIRLEGGESELRVCEQALYLGHSDAVKPRLSVGENLLFWAGFLGPARAETHTALAQVGLAGLARIPAMYLSAGQRRRLALARLVLIGRPIWLLDEPTASLDQEGCGMLCGLMQTHLSAAGIIVLASDDPLELESASELPLRGKR